MPRFGLPWRRPVSQPAVVTETAPPTPAQVARAGFEYGIPRGGTTVLRQTADGSGNSDDRGQLLQQLYEAYLACPWASAAVDVTARTITAGGLEIHYDGDSANIPTEPANVQALRRLIDFVNPTEDIRQLLRGIVTDLEVFGDAFLEIVWLLGQPVALYSLDAPTMRIIADEHGNVEQYVQYLEDGRRAEFNPDEVIHFSVDSPRSGLNGVGSVQKALLPITTWLFTMATVKETMRKGDPPQIWADHPAGTSDSEILRWRARYLAGNVGPRNIGAPITTKGGAKVAELKTNRVIDYLATLTEARDSGLSTMGVPPAKVGVIESGNIGGGTGTSQDKTFRVNKCAPIAEVILEKLNYHLVRRGFAVDGWSLRFGEFDWRDDMTVEQIRDMRLRNGAWSLNRYLDDIDEPKVGDEGDQHVLVDRQNIVLWADIAAMSKAQIAAKSGAGAVPAAGTDPAAGPDDTDPVNDPDGDQPDAVTAPAQRSTKPGVKTSRTEAIRTGDRAALTETYLTEHRARVRQLLARLNMEDPAV